MPPPNSAGRANAIRRRELLAIRVTPKPDAGKFDSRTNGPVVWTGKVVKKNCDTLLGLRPVVSVTKVPSDL